METKRGARTSYTYNDPFCISGSKWKIDRSHARCKVRRLDDCEPEFSRDGRLDARSVKLTVSLSSVGITSTEKCAVHLHRVVNSHSNAQTFIVQVSSTRHGWNRVNKVMRGWSQTHASLVFVNLGSKVSENEIKYVRKLSEQCLRLTT